MTDGHILFRIAIATLAVGLSSCGSSPSQATAPSRSAAPDVVLADAMQRRDPALALPLVKQAADKAPERADIAWLYSQLCAQVAGCRPEGAEARLRRLDPENAAAWLGALARARQARDVAAENEVLDAMGRAKRFDIYWNTLVSKIAVVTSSSPAAQANPTTDLLTANLDAAIGWLSGTVVPAFGPIGDACSSARLTNPAMAQRCRLIAEALVRGDSFVAESFGLGIAERLAKPGSPQATAIQQQIRRARYQRDTAGQVIAAQVERDKFSRELIKLMSSLRREQDVYRAVIRWSGQPVEPAG